MTRSFLFLLPMTGSYDMDAGIIPQFAGCINGVNWFKERGSGTVMISGLHRVWLSSSTGIPRKDSQDGLSNHVGIMKSWDTASRLMKGRDATHCWTASIHSLFQFSDNLIRECGSIHKMGWRKLQPIRNSRCLNRTDQREAAFAGSCQNVWYYIGICATM